MFNILKLLFQVHRHAHLAVNDPDVFAHFHMKADRSPAWVKGIVERKIRHAFQLYFSK